VEKALRIKLFSFSDTAYEYISLAMTAMNSAKTVPRGPKKKPVYLKIRTESARTKTIMPKPVPALETGVRRELNSIKSGTKITAFDSRSMKLLTD